MAYLLVTLLILAAATPTGDIAFDPTRGLVEVEVTLDGRAKGRFGIDTGADGLYVDRDFALQHHLRISEDPVPYDIVGLDGRSNAFSLPLRSLQIGCERLYNLSAAAIDMSELTASDDIQPPDGLLGHDILRRFYVTVDYPNHRMRLETSQPDFLKNGSYVSIPFTIHGHLIVVEITFNVLTKVSMALDYCASHTAITPELAERLGLDAKLNARVTAPSMQLADGVVTTEVRSVVTDLSSIISPTRSVSIKGILGSTFLVGHKITVDYRRQLIYIHQD